MLEQIKSERAYSSNIHLCHKYVNLILFIFHHFFILLVLFYRIYYIFSNLLRRSGRFDVQLPDKTLQVERGRIMDVLHQEMHSKNINIHFGMKYVLFLFYFSFIFSNTGIGV